VIAIESERGSFGEGVSFSSLLELWWNRINPDMLNGVTSPFQANVQDWSWLSLSLLIVMIRPFCSSTDKTVSDSSISSERRGALGLSTEG
jgi:hypothetical protein